MITIGLDPHPDSHTVAALDENGSDARVFDSDQYDAEGLAHCFTSFASSFSEHRWAVEGAANRFILPFVCDLTRARKGGASHSAKPHQSVPRPS